jgi:hypothetical protein
MATVRVQLKRTILGAPSIGKWNVYSGAWFSAADPVPSATVRTYLQRLFMGQHPTLTSTGYKWTGNEVFSQAANAADIRTWEWTGAQQVLRYSGVWTVEAWSPGVTQKFPQQACVAIGYRRALVGGEKPQKGRSRFFIGPLLSTTGLFVADAHNTLTASNATVDIIQGNALAGIQALAGQGWVLQVKSGTGANLSFAAANELYVDNVIDVMRSRRAPRTYQKRTAI